MKTNKYIASLILTLLFGLSSPAWGQENTVKYRFYFPVGMSKIDLSFRDNGLKLDSLVDNIQKKQNSGILKRMVLKSSASPEGLIVYNKRLAEKRLQSLRSLLQERLGVDSSIFATETADIDWEGLVNYLKNSDIPYKEEAINIVENTPIWVFKNGKVVDSRKKRLMDLRGGRVWNMLFKRYFPELRFSQVVGCEFEFQEAEKETAIESHTLLK